MDSVHVSEGEAQGHTRHLRDPRPNENANRAGDRGTEPRKPIGQQHARRDVAQRNPGLGRGSRPPRRTSRKRRLRDGGEGRSEAIGPAARYERSRSSSRAATPRSRWRIGDTAGVGACRCRPSFSGGAECYGVQRRADRANTRAASPLQTHVRRYGSRTSRSRQIFRARKSLISRWRGTVEVLRTARFTKTE